MMGNAFAQDAHGRPPDLLEESKIYGSEVKVEEFEIKEASISSVF